MVKAHFRFKRLLQQLKYWFGFLLIVVLAFSSCVKEAEVVVMEPETKSAFDAELQEVLEIMEGNSSAALEKLDMLITEADAIDSKHYAGRAKWFKAYIYDEILEDVSKAYHSYNEALKDVLQTDDSSLKIKIYNNLGILYRFYEQYDAAIENYEAALRLEDDLTIEQRSDLYYNYGVALKLKGDDASFQKAENAFTTSLAYAQEVDYHENIASVYSQIGLMYKAIENYDMARLAYNNTIRTYVGDTEMHEYVGKAFHGIGVTYMDEKNREASVEAFQKALQYKRKSGSIFITKYDMGTVLLRDGKTAEAIAVWKDALNEKHNKNSIEQVQIYADLTLALKSDDQYEEALGYSEVYNSSVQDILQKGELYKNRSNQVLFANVVSEYEEFNQPVPFFSRPLVILSILLTFISLIYAFVSLYHRSKSQKELTEIVSKIQTKFLDIKVD